MQIAMQLLMKMDFYGHRRTLANMLLVPLAGIEPALLAELDFESSVYYSKILIFNVNL